MEAHWGHVASRVVAPSSFVLSRCRIVSLVLSHCCPRGVVLSLPRRVILSPRGVTLSLVELSTLFFISQKKLTLYRRNNYSLYQHFLVPSRRTVKIAHEDRGLQNMDKAERFVNFFYVL